MFGRISSIFIIGFMGLSFPVFFVFAFLIRVLTQPFDKKLVILQQYTCFWGSVYSWIMPVWRIEITGRKKCRKNTPYIIVSNHQSQLDILVNFRLFFHFKIVSKDEIFKVPFMGWNMTLNRYIKLKRGEKSSIKKMLDDCQKALVQGSSVFFYPEGTRSRDGEIKNFKDGAFILAKKVKVPILPVVLDGTGNALPKRVMQTTGIHSIKVKVIDEITYEKFEDLSVEETSEMVMRIMKKELILLRGSEN